MVTYYFWLMVVAIDTLTLLEMSNLSNLTFSLIMAKKISNSIRPGHRQAQWRWREANTGT
jgi:hypothetical protein